MTVTKEEWQETIETRKAALELFERENAQAIRQSRELLDAHSRLATAANEDAPPGYVRCGGYDDDDEGGNEISCEEIVPHKDAGAAGWQAQWYSCGDETGELVCPSHKRQSRVEGRCDWCSR